MPKKCLRIFWFRCASIFAADIPVVGLEPSCVSVFRDELKRLFPYDEDAQRLSRNAMTISEFLVEHSQFEFPKLNRKAIVHGHCHDKAVMKMKAEAELLQKNRPGI